MKKILREKPHQPFFAIALVSAAIAIFLKLIHPEALFSVSIFNIDITQYQFRLWTWFTIYFMILTGIYFAIFKTELKTKRWLVMSHYVFIILFLAFFILFSIFGSNDMMTLMPNIPLNTFITIYGIIFLADVIMFLIGVIFLIINLITLKEK